MNNHFPTGYKGDDARQAYAFLVNKFGSGVMDAFRQHFEEWAIQYDGTYRKHMTDQMFNKMHGLHDCCGGKNVVDFITQNFCGCSAVPVSTANEPMLFDSRELVQEFAQLLISKDVRVWRNQLEQKMYDFKQNVVSFAGSVQNAARKAMNNNEYELPFQTICVAYVDRGYSIVVSLVFDKSIACDIDFYQEELEYDDSKDVKLVFKDLTADELELFGDLLPAPSTFIMDVMDKIRAK